MIKIPKKGRPQGRYRWYGEHEYDWYSRHKKKDLATKRAKQLRKEGFNARVIKRGKNYDVFYEH